MKGKRTPEQLMEAGLSLTPKCPKNIPKRQRIMYQEFGTDGKLYGKIQKMTRQEQRIAALSEKEKREGKAVWFQYEPLKLMMKFPYHLDVKKDKQGNVTVVISERKTKEKERQP